MTDETATDSATAPEPQPAGSLPIPPYISFSTFLTFLTELKTNGMPPQIDNSVLKRFSYGVQVQLRGALKSLGLMDGGKPTPRLARLVEVYETPAFEEALHELLRDNYPYVFALDLTTATPSMFADAFKVTGAKEDVARKCRTFFLYAAKRAGVVLGNRILTGSVPRTTASNGARRKAKGAKPKDDTVTDNAGLHEHSHKPAKDGDLMDKLLGKFPDFDPGWPDEMKAKWFASFQDFMKVAKAK